MLNVDQVIQGDSIKILNDSAEGWVDLVFADPPFNIGYLYHNYNDKRNDKDYLKFSEEWMRAVYRVLKPTGSFFLAIGDEYAADLCVIARRQIGFNLRNWIIWHYTFGQQTTQKFAKSHTHILYFTKSETGFTFNADAIRVASARQLIYADSRANPKGKVPDDTWYLRDQTQGKPSPPPEDGKLPNDTWYLRPQETSGEYFKPDSATWNVSRVCGTFKEREGWHGCQMPIAVLDRIIKSASNPGDIVLDPFNGSGTTVVSAALHGRKYIGIDQSAEYVDFARQRLEHAKKQAEEAKKAGEALQIAPEVKPSAIFAPDRPSRVMTPTDSLGRPRVKRTYGKRKKTA